MGRKRGKLEVQFMGSFVVVEDLGKERFRLQDSKSKVLKTKLTVTDYNGG